MTNELPRGPLTDEELEQVRIAMTDWDNFNGELPYKSTSGLVALVDQLRTERDAATAQNARDAVEITELRSDRDRYLQTAIKLRTVLESHGIPMLDIMLEMGAVPDRKQLLDENESLKEERSLTLVNLREACAKAEEPNNPYDRVSDWFRHQMWVPVAVKVRAIVAERNQLLDENESLKLQVADLNRKLTRGVTEIKCLDGD